MGAVGKKLSSGFRFEGELSYRTNDFNDITASGTTTVSGVTLTGTNVAVTLDGDVSSFSFMANTAYDFMKDSKYHPYTMSGVGGALVSFNSASVSGVTLVDDEDFVFAYQVSACADGHPQESGCEHSGCACHG